MEGSVERSAVFIKCRTCFAPSRSVYPQSPSPTIVSYSVIVDSSFMTLSQPAVIIWRTCVSENWIFEALSLNLVDGTEEMLVASVFEGVACAERNVEGMEQREMAQPRFWDWESRIVDWVMYDGRFSLTGGLLARSALDVKWFLPRHSEISWARILFSRRERPLISE